MNTSIYIIAARLVDNQKEEFSCNAIWPLSNFTRTNKRKAYASLFGIRNGETFHCLYKKYYKAKPNEDELREIRVLALCFAAAYFSDENNQK